MIGGGEALSYNLYLDASRTVIWGDGSGITSVHGDSRASAAPITVTIFARISPQQDVSAGTYTDTITATINF
jgi:spore coat protein U-like protein